MARGATLSPEQIDEIRQIGETETLRETARLCGVSLTTVFYILHPQARKIHEARCQRRRPAYRDLGFAIPPAARHPVKAVHPPRHVIAESVRAYGGVIRNSPADIMGDPAPGRSALDRRKPHLVIG